MTITNELFLHGQKQADRTNEIIVYVDGCQFRRLDDTRFERLPDGRKRHTLDWVWFPERWAYIPKRGAR